MRPWLFLLGVLSVFILLACSEPTPTPVPTFSPPDGERATPIGLLNETTFWQDKEPFWLVGCQTDIRVSQFSSGRDFTPFSDDGNYRSTTQLAMISRAGWPREYKDQVESRRLGCVALRVVLAKVDTYCKGYGATRFECPESEQLHLPHFYLKGSSAGGIVPVAEWQQ